MKKLMIAAAAVAMIGAAQAEATGCQIAEKPADAAAFVWKFQGKTTAGAAVESILASACNLDTQACVIRVPAALAIQGYTYVCENCCDTYADYGSMVHETKKGLQTFFMTKPFKSIMKAVTIGATGHIIGKKANQYELYGDIALESAEPGVKYTLTFAGLGSWNKTYVLPTAVSGNFAGTAEAPYFIGYIGKTLVCNNADWWICGDYVFANAPTAKSVAYGAWSMRYNSTAAKNYKKGIEIALPAWVREIK